MRKRKPVIWTWLFRMPWQYTLRRNMLTVYKCKQGGARACERNQFDVWEISSYPTVCGGGHDSHDWRVIRGDTNFCKLLPPLGAACKRDWGNKPPLMNTLNFALHQRFSEFLTPLTHFAAASVNCHVFVLLSRERARWFDRRMKNWFVCDPHYPTSCWTGSGAT